MKLQSLAILFALASTGILMCQAHAQPAPPAPLIANKDEVSFEKFDRRAKAGDHLNVVFFGASLTWGANASDPNLTSYRAFVARKLEAAYPNAHFHFWDAAIGGTNSQLGVFRFQRDVLRRRPNLVFLDFTLNDNPYAADPETLASYESLVRRCIVQARAPLVQMFLPSREMVAEGTTDRMLRRSAHLLIAHAYGCGIGDAIALGQDRLWHGQLNLDKLWPSDTDKTHPGDKGYALYADAAWQGLADAIARGQVCRAPATMMNARTYLANARVRLSHLGDLPEGWRLARPNRTSAFYDMLMSRWLDDETIAVRSKEADSAQPGALRVRFNGSMALLFGESTLQSGKYRVSIDGGEAKEYDAGALGRAAGGNAQYYQVVAQGLDVGVEHTLQIEPVLEPGQELRLESICVAGGKARLELEKSAAGP